MPLVDSRRGERIGCPVIGGAPMPRPRKTESAIDLRQLALIGARARLAELETERQSILKTFPQLSRGRLDGAGPTLASSEADSAPKPAAPRRKRKISAEGRRRIAEAARRRWAEWRKQNRA
jgi:hypothetical protein